MLGYFCNQTGLVGRTIGKIDVKGVYSFVEVPNADVDQAFNAFKSAEFKGRQVRIEISADGGNESRGGWSNKKREGGSNGGNRRDGGNRGSERSGSGFRDFSGKRREDRGERRKRY